MHSKQDRLKVIWLQGITCNGNTHSFLNYNNLELLLNQIEFLYHPLLPSKYSIEDIALLKDSCDILIFEGAFSKSFKRAGVNILDIFKYYAKDAKHIIALGSCASFGGIFQNSVDDGSGLVYKNKNKIDLFNSFEKKIINLSGCPAHPEWLGYIFEMILNNIKIVLDDFKRPVELYSNLAHHGCTRNEYFEWKVDSNSFGLKEGCLFYKQGCKGPMTHSICNKILWNSVSSKTRVGTPCFGCTEFDFPKKNLFTTKTNMSIPEDIPVGVPKRAYLTLAGIAKTFHIKRLEEKLIDYKTDN